MSQGGEATRGQIALLLCPNDRVRGRGNQKRAQLFETTGFSGEQIGLLSHSALFVVARAIFASLVASVLVQKAIALGVEDVRLQSVLPVGEMSYPRKS